MQCTHCDPFTNETYLTLHDNGDIGCTQCGVVFVPESRLDSARQTIEAQSAAYEARNDQLNEARSRLDRALRLLRSSDGNTRYRETVNAFLRECEPAVEKQETK